MNPLLKYLERISYYVTNKLLGQKGTVPDHISVDINLTVESIKGVCSCTLKTKCDAQIERYIQDKD